MATVFGGCHVVLDLTTSVSFKRKQEIRKKITENDGVVSYIVTKKSTHVICNDPAKADISYKCKMAQKYGIPVVSVNFLYDCVEKGRLLSTDDYLVIGKTKSQKLKSGRIAATKYQILGKRKKSSFYPGGAKAWPLHEKHTPTFNHTKYQVAKYALLKKYVKSAGRAFFCVLEVHVNEERDLLPGQTYRFRVSKHHGNLKNIQDGKPEKMECYYVETSEEATKMYTYLYKQQTDPPNLMEVSHDAPPRGVGTLHFQKMMVTFGLEKTELSAPVCELVEGIWKEAYSDLSDIITSPSSVKLEQIEKAEALLMKLKCQPEDKESILNEYYTSLPHNTKVSVNQVNNAWMSSEQDICQVMKDMLTVSEATGWSLRGSTESKYRALRCQIEHRPPDHHVYKTVKALVNKSIDSSVTRLNIVNVFEVHRQLEEDNFTKDVHGQTLLFHASKPNNFVGILSRGLLMPKMVVDDFGGTRTDAGMLGAGIYFASAASTSVKYSQVSKSRGTRMMLVNKVALGKCMDLYSHDQTLTHAPDGYSSVHGVASTSNKSSDFTEDEYVVYSPDQQKMCYLVEFTVSSETPIPMEIVHTEENMETNTQTLSDKINLKDVKDVLDLMSKVKPGLVADGKEVNPVELEKLDVFAKLMDLVAEVKVFQVYKNNSAEMLEGKYVFPLDEMAAVCGFEAYINDKHVVGEVKEKETAHKEYKKAISEGHGAYLMDQDEESPDVFTVTVGNVPAYATVVIKITYVTELQVEGDLVSFRLPGTLAPWKQNIKDYDIECVIAVAVDMPFDLRNIQCPTHKIVIMDFDAGRPRKVKNRKPKGCKALVLTDEEATMAEGFHLLFELAEVHIPRMWIEQSEEDPSNQACMMTFYPDFEAIEDSQAEVILLLDLSNSMTDKGLDEAKKILLLILHYLPKSWTFNFIIFGTAFRELFPSSQPINKSNTAAAEALIQSVDANMGNTDLYRPLHSFYLLKPENALRNIFLVSDGHINHKDVTMDTVHKNSQHTRVFTFGVSSVMNRHLLGALARVGAGAFEGFDSKAKSKWEGKVKSQIAKAGQPGLTSVAVSWQQEDGAPPPKQAPNQITALFSGSRMVVYGFVKNCSSATLTAEIGDQEIAALVTKSDRYVTKGKILHRLAAKAIIRDWEDGLLSPDGLNQQRMKMDLKGYVIKLSKEFCIVTSLTSFIAVEKREKDEEMTCAPDIYELLDEVRENVCSFLRLDITPNDFEAALDSDDESYSYSTDDTGEHEEEEKKGESDRKSPVPRQYAFFGAGGDDYEVISSSHDHDIPTANPEYCLMSQEKESPEDVYEAALGEVYGLLSDLEEDVYDDMYCNADSEVERSHSRVSEGESIPSSLLVTEKMSMMSEEESDEEEEMGFGLFEDDHAADFIVEKQMKLSSEEDSKQDHPVTLLCADSLPSLSERSASPKTSFLPTTIEEDVSEAISCTIARPDKVATSVSPRPLGAGPPEVPLFDMMDLKSRGRPDHTSGMLKTYRHLSQFHPIELSEIQPPPAMAFTPGAAPSHQQQSAMAVTLGAPPQTQSAMAYTSEVPLPLPQQAANRSAISAPSAGPPPPPPPRQMLDMAFTLSGPPPPPRAPSAGPPLPPQMLDMAFTSSGPPPPPRAPSAKPPPPPPMLGKDFTSSGPPRPPRAPSARPPLPPPMLDKAFTSSGPPPPPPVSLMAVTSSRPPSRSNFRLAGPPPPPPMPYKAFTSSGSSSPPMPQITFCKMSAKIPSSHKSYSSDDDDEYYRVHSLSKPSRPDPIPMSLDYDLDDVPKYKDEGKDGVVHFACSQVLEKCDSIPSPASIPADETEVIVISEELTAQKASRTKKKKAMLSISKPLKKIDLEQSVSWRKCESPDFFRKMDQENDLLEADQKKPTEHAKKIPVGRKCHGMRVTESIERNTEELSFQRAGAYRTRSSGGSCCMGPRTATYENTRNGRALHVDGRWVQDKERPEELHGFLSKVKDKSGGKGRSLNDLTDREPDLADVGSKMPVIAKAAKKNLSKKEFDILKKIQNKLGGWTRDELEKDLYIDLSACIEVLNTAGLKSLGVKVAMEMENVLVTAFVVMWILKTLAPELFPLDTTTRNWSQTAVEIAAAVLEIYDHDRSLLDKAVQYCDQLERAHPGVAYILELGSNWFNVASKILGL